MADGGLCHTIRTVVVYVVIVDNDVTRRSKVGELLLPESYDSLDFAPTGILGLGFGRQLYRDSPLMKLARSAYFRYSI